MTKEDIKKALEFCADDYHSCNDCPYDVVRHCTDTLKTDALNLIIEQESEIAQLKDGYARVQEQFAQYQIASDKEIKAQRKQAQIDVLNRLKVFSEPYPNSWGIYVIDVDHIDKLIKKVEDENK